MKRFALALTLLSLIVVAVAVPVLAQDDMMDSHICDSTTILLLFIAENDYDYEPMMDVSTFEKGQFAPYFEAMMMMDEGMMDEDMGDDEMMDEEMGDDMDGDMMDMVTLELPVIADEDPACTELRASLDSFFTTAIADMMMMDDMDSDG